MRESQTTIPTYHKLSTLQTPSLYLCITLVMMWNTGCTVHWLPDEDSLDHLGSSVYWWCLLLLYYPHISQHWPVYALIILMYFCAKRKMHKYILQHCCSRSDRVIALHLVCLPLFPFHISGCLSALWRSVLWPIVGWQWNFRSSSDGFWMKYGAGAASACPVAEAINVDNRPIQSDMQHC